MAVNDIYRLALEYQSGTGVLRAVNVFHYRQVSAAIQPSDSEDLADAFLADVVPDIANAISTGFLMARISVRGVTTPTEGYDLAFTGVPGVQGGDTLPFQVGALILWRTGLIGRRYQGRTFLPPPGELVAAGSGTWVPTYLTTVGTAAAQIQTIVSGGSHGAWSLVVHSEKYSQSTPVTTFVVSPIAATQRRRRL